MIQINKQEWVCLKCGNINQNSCCSACGEKKGQNSKNVRYLNEQDKKQLEKIARLSDKEINHGLIKYLKIKANENYPMVQFILYQIYCDYPILEKRLEAEYWMGKAKENRNIPALLIGVLTGDIDEIKTHRHLFTELTKYDFEESKWFFSLGNIPDEIKGYVDGDNLSSLYILIAKLLEKKNELDEAKKWYEMGNYDVYSNEGIQIV